MNKIDEVLTEIINCGEDLIFISELPLTIDKPSLVKRNKNDVNNDINDSKIIMKFLSLILKNAINKEMFNSTQVI